MKRLILRRAVIAEITDAAAWYHERRPDLGPAFLLVAALLLVCACTDPPPVRDPVFPTTIEQPPLALWPHVPRGLPFRDARWPMTVEDAEAILIASDGYLLGEGNTGNTLPPTAAIALNVVLDQHDPLPILERIAYRGTPAGRLWALSGLTLIHDPSAERVRAALLESDEKVWSGGGCILSEDAVADWARQLANAPPQTFLRALRNETFARLDREAKPAALPSVDTESVCFGTVSDGRLEGGVKLIAEGPNFRAYSSLGRNLGRTYVHARVRDIVLAAYTALETAAPGKVFVYGETGWSGGGRIRPHRTHQNGTSVDFFVPVRDRSGRSVAVPTSVSNRFGYDLEFDEEGRYGEYTIDFEAMAEHLYQLRLAAAEHGVGLALVIVDAPYIPKLLATRRGPFLERYLPFMKGKPWIRHDEHYHVDFDVPCRE